MPYLPEKQNTISFSLTVLYPQPNKFRTTPLLPTCHPERSGTPGVKASDATKQRRAVEPRPPGGAPAGGISIVPTRPRNAHHPATSLPNFPQPGLIPDRNTYPITPCTTTPDTHSESNPAEESSGRMGGVWGGKGTPYERGSLPSPRSSPPQENTIHIRRQRAVAGVARARRVRRAVSFRGGMRSSLESSRRA